MILSYLSEKGVRPVNEDAVLVHQAQGIYGVFDGSSSLDSFLTSDGKTGAYIAAHVACDTFESSTRSLTETLIQADSNIDQAHVKYNIDTSSKVNRFSTTVAVVEIAKDTAELLQVGDSIIIAIYRDGLVEAPLGYENQDLEMLQKWRRLADEGKTNIRQLVNDDIVKQRALGNIMYGTLNGDGEATAFVRQSQVSLQDVQTLLILSDGLFIPKADPATTEDWNYVAQLYQTGGLTKLYQTVRSMEESDPNLTIYPRVKLHDDASAVAIDFD